MAHKLESTIRNMVISLGLISLIAGVALAATYVATKPSIEAGRLAKKVAALRAVLPEFDNDPLGSERKNPDGTITYLATLKGVSVGTAVQATSPRGFSGDVTLMTGFTPQGAVYKVAVLAQKETPGLGTKMTEPTWLAQFQGMLPGAKPVKVKKDGGTVDAITASTISSRAVCDSINRAASALKTNADSPVEGVTP